jgi:hypothetical protein
MLRWRPEVAVHDLLYLKYACNPWLVGKKVEVGKVGVGGPKDHT